MSPILRPKPSGLRLAPASILAFSLALPAVAQVVNPPKDLPEEPTKARIEVSSGIPKAGEDTVELSPFTVTADNNGYQASNTMSGTRLNTKIEDLASSITVVTKQQMLDTAAVDINDIFSNEGSTEGIYQFTDFTIDRGFTVDNVAQTPETSNRIRGLGSANLARGNFVTSRAIPVDTYNVDSVEITRGPNSNIFGLGGSSGTVNVITGRANLTRDITQMAVRTDDRGSYRSTFDLNRVLWKNKFSVRVAGVHDNTEYVRQPSRDRTNRMTAALSFRPFRDTTIRASYESYHNFASRANSTTPRDTITEWRANGSPVWDPTFSNGIGGWRLLNGSSYTAVAANQEATLLPRGINPNGTGFWNRPSLYVNPDGSIGRYEVNRSALAPTGTNLPSPGQANANLRYQQIGTVYQRGGGVFGVPLSPLFQQPGVTDQSIYDWEEINYAAPNSLNKKADIYQVELEQWLVRGQRHQLALQAGIMREDVMSTSRSYVGASDGAPPVIQVDINEKLLDGTANPYFLRPYIGGSEMQAFRKPEMNDNARATLAYQLDMTQNKGWSKWFGRHNFAAYGEYRQTRFASNANGLRYREQIISNESWMSAANLTNLPARGAETRFYTRYYMGDPVSGSSVIDYAGSAPLKSTGTQTLRWFNAATGQWINESVEVGEVYFALGNQKQQIRTRGLIWQGFLWDDRIIPTMGWRRDKSRTVSNVTVPLGSDGYFDTHFLDVYPSNWLEISGPTNTKGVVVNPLKGWKNIEDRANNGNFLMDVARSVRFHYNESDSFQPVPTATNLFGAVLPNPSGTGKDYGISFSAFSGKVNVRINRYETLDQNSRAGSTGVLATRPLRLDFDISGDNSVFGTIGGDTFDLEDNAATWVTSLNPTMTIDQAKAEVYKMIGISEAFVNSIKNQPVISDVNDVSSKGTEIEIYYNPSKFWTMKANVVQSEAVDLNLSPFIAEYLALRLPTWTTLRIPTGIVPATGLPLPNAGQLWWDVGAPGATGNNVPRNFFSSAVDSPYKLAVTNSGKPRPQTREYRFNLTSNYKLAGLGSDSRWLKNMSVGGTARWESKATVGFYGKAPEADGAIRELDGGRPIYDKARQYLDLMWSYNFKLFNDRVNTRLQLNVRNVLENGRLQAVSYNPDGTPWNFRIIDPRQFILTATFDF